MPESAQESLARARSWIGRETPLRWGKYPVEYEPIRRWCAMVDCTHPLYLEEDLARKTRWGGVICPPLMIPMFAGAVERQEWPLQKAVAESDVVPPTSKERSVGISREFEFSKVVRIGDRLGFKRRLVDVTMRPIKLDKEAIWVTTEATFFNQYMDVVAVARRTSIKYDHPIEKKAETAPSPEPPAILGPTEQNTPSSQKQIYFDEVTEGEKIPGYSLYLDQRRFHLQTSGTQFFGLKHLDEEHARRSGLPHIFLDDGFTQAALARVLTDWMGNDGWLAKFEMQLRKMNLLGDLLTLKGRVVRKYLKDGGGYVDCEVWAENQRDGISTPGKATITLPLRTG